MYGVLFGLRAAMPISGGVGFQRLSTGHKKSPLSEGARGGDFGDFVPSPHGGKTGQRYEIFGGSNSVCEAGFSGDTAEAR